MKVKTYKIIVLPVVLYGCETWSLALREEHKLRMFENEGLRNILGTKKDEITGEWRKLHNYELHALYFSYAIIRNLKWRRVRWEGAIQKCIQSERDLQGDRGVDGSIILKWI